MQQKCSFLLLVSVLSLAPKRRTESPDCCRDAKLNPNFNLNPKPKPNRNRTESVARWNGNKFNLSVSDAFRVLRGEKPRQKKENLPPGRSLFSCTAWCIIFAIFLRVVFYLFIFFFFGSRQSQLSLLCVRLSSSFCGNNDTQHHYLPHTDSWRFLSRSRTCDCFQGLSTWSAICPPRCPSSVTWNNLNWTAGKLLQNRALAIRTQTQSTKPKPKPMPFRF